MRAPTKCPATRAADQGNSARSAEDLATQIAELSARVRGLIQELDASRPAVDRPVHYLSSLPALSAAVYQVYQRAGLTPREVEVCAYLIRGYSDGDSARALGISLGTIKTHVAKVCQKLNVERKRIAWDFFVRRSI